MEVGGEGATIQIDEASIVFDVATIKRWRFNQNSSQLIFHFLFLFRVSLRSSILLVWSDEIVFLFLT